MLLATVGGNYDMMETGITRDRIAGLAATTHDADKLIESFFL
jgi:hypothetical protein